MKNVPVHIVIDEILAIENFIWVYFHVQIILAGNNFNCADKENINILVWCVWDKNLKDDVF